MPTSTPAPAAKHSLNEYSRRMNTVLNHIDAHLDAPLDLTQLAQVAHFSPFHFHRLFAAWMGETLGDYLRRRRLEVAALRLAAQPDMSILAVAFSVGFGSGEAFSRAFKQHFSYSPSSWRRDTKQRWATQLAQAKLRQSAQDSNLDQLISKPSQAIGCGLDHDEVFNHPIMEIRMKVELVEFAPARIAYLRQIGPYGATIGQFWSQVFHPWLQAQGIPASPMYGLSHDDPSITPPEKCRYDAAIEVRQEFVATGKAMLTTLPGGRYAVAKFIGTSQEIGDAWVELFKGWLPASGMLCDDRPCFERYPVGSRVDPVTGVFDCELCIPVRAM
ncbi:AraC family transcriptional regulator [Undibacterium sp. Jales W-56]|uniref:AraC family transcriptional regulator n=1 Tax=Undibacterium sp. Jales W-56 TaxID=2897325 RepID=UPI0021D1A39D|nr:AraC family transcriptional regulator [Undibacterium sp. Jales W-56]MCU6434227.1 AraC family transcriptional regulator [Undibacterium sp. Jales W-56]